MSICDLIRTVTSIAARAAKRLRPMLAGIQAGPCLLAGVDIVVTFKKKTKSRRKCRPVDEDGVWRKGIIMGEKCDTLAFSGAIHYDICDVI